jgi:CubicO group peptidase (beta-lactamase class C family)
LIDHRSGFDSSVAGDPLIRNQVPAGYPRSCKEAILLQSNPEIKPNAAYKYSNIGYCFLSMELERLYGKPYGEVASAYIAEKLKTTDREKSADIKNVMCPEFHFLLGAGGICMSQVNTAKVLGQILRGLPETQPSQIISSDQFFYADGWRVWKKPDGYLYSHFGYVPGSFTAVLGRRDGALVTVFVPQKIDKPQEFFARIFPHLEKWLAEIK